MAYLKIEYVLHLNCIANVYIEVLHIWKIYQILQKVWFFKKNVFPTALLFDWTLKCVILFGWLVLFCISLKSHFYVWTPKEHYYFIVFWAPSNRDNNIKCSIISIHKSRLWNEVLWFDILECFCCINHDSVLYKTFDMIV